jgi:hypothetical protein
VCQPNDPGSVLDMPHSETAITRGNLIKLLPPTKFSVSARCQVFSCLPKSKLNLQLCRLYICFGFYFPSLPVLITDWSSSLFRQEYTSAKYTKVRVLLQQFAMLYLYLISAFMTFSHRTLAKFDLNTSIMVLLSKLKIFSYQLAWPSPACQPIPIKSHLKIPAEAKATTAFI